MEGIQDQKQGKYCHIIIASIIIATLFEYPSPETVFTISIIKRSKIFRATHITVFSQNQTESQNFICQWNTKAHNIITISSQYYHNIITISSQYHQNIITISSQYHHDIITIPSQYHHNIITTPIGVGFNMTTRQQKQSQLSNAVHRVFL